MSTKFLEASPGNKSLSRLIAAAVIGIALFDAQILLFYGIIHPTTVLMPIATAVGALFASVASPALTYMFFTKKDENKVTIATTPPPPTPPVP